MEISKSRQQTKPRVNHYDARVPVSEWLMEITPILKIEDVKERDTGKGARDEEGKTLAGRAKKPPGKQRKGDKCY